MIASVKKTIKAGLHRAGLLNIGQYVYFNLKTASPAVLGQELFARQKGDNGYPIPPAKLVYDIIACRWAGVYLSSGKIVVSDMEAQLKDAGYPLGSFKDILDFGCGCGRLIRQVHKLTDANLYGTDYNPGLVSWCDQNLTFASFSKNELAPPLKYNDASFDFIYARSVFTHLPEALTKQWLTELSRVLRRGGKLYFTIHGSMQAKGLSDAQKTAFGEGEWVETYASVAGENLCSTYASKACVEQLVNQAGGKIIKFVPGREIGHLKQDIYVAVF